MSADAKMWPEKNDGRDWRGHHDGDCILEKLGAKHEEDSLSELVTSIELCRGHRLRWEFRKMSDGSPDLENIVLFGYDA